MRLKQEGATARRNFLPSLSNFLPSLMVLALCVAFSCACGVRQSPVSNAATGANTNTAANTNAAPGAREGAGPHDTGIGGTGEGSNANRGVSGNTNIEPTGVNKNAGRTPNANSSAANANR
jgi:hypothetical protein